MLTVTFAPGGRPGSTYVAVNISAETEPAPRPPSTARSHNIITFAAALRPPATPHGALGHRVLQQARAICDAQFVQPSSGGSALPGPRGAFGEGAGYRT